MIAILSYFSILAVAFSISIAIYFQLLNIELI